MESGWRLLDRFAFTGSGPAAQSVGGKRALIQRWSEPVLADFTLVHLCTLRMILFLWTKALVLAVSIIFAAFGTSPWFLSWIV
jgi:hypothetical protein